MVAKANSRTQKGDKETAPAVMPQQGAAVSEKVEPVGAQGVASKAIDTTFKNNVAQNLKNNAEEQTKPVTSAPKYTLADMVNMWNPPVSDKEREDARKKNRRDKIFAAIGDGLSALSNLYFTTQYAPNMWDGKNTATERTKANYEKLMDDFKERDNNYWSKVSQAIQLDNSAEARKRAEERQDAKDKADAAEREYARQLANDKWEYQKKKDEAEAEAKKEQQKIENAREDKLADARVKYYGSSGGSSSSSSSSGSGSGKGNWEIFSDGNKNNVRIAANVWDNSMPQVYETLVREMTELNKIDAKKYPLPRLSSSGLTAADMENYVKRYWTYGGKTRVLMKQLGSIGPDTQWGVESYNEKPKEKKIIDFDDEEYERIRKERKAGIN